MADNQLKISIEAQDQLSKSVEQALSNVAKLATSLAAALEPISRAMASIGAEMAKISQPAQAAGAAIAQGVGGALEQIQQSAGGAGSSVAGALQEASKGAANVSAAVSKATGDVGTLGESATQASGSATTAFGAVAGAISDTAKSAEGAGKASETALQGVAQSAANAGQAMQNAGGVGAKGLTEVSSSGGAVNRTFATAGDAAKAMGDSASAAGARGADALKGMANASQGAAQQVKGLEKDAAAVSFSFRTAADAADFFGATSKRAAEESSRSFTEFNQALELVKKGIRLVTGALDLLVFKPIKIGVGFIEDFAEGEAVAIRLAAALRAAAGASDETITRVTDLASSIAHEFGFAQTSVEAMLQRLVAFGKVAPEQLDSVSRSVIDFATQLGGGLEEAAALVSRATAQIVGQGLEPEKVALRGVRLEMETTGNAARDLTTFFGKLAEGTRGSADAMKGSATVALREVEARFGELKEKIGERLFDAEPTQRAFAIVIDAIEQMTDAVANLDQTSINSFVSGFLGGLSAVAEGVVGLAKFIVGTIGTAFGEAARSFAEIKIEGIGPFDGLKDDLDELKTKAESTKEFLQTLNEEFPGTAEKFKAFSEGLGFPPIPGSALDSYREASEQLAGINTEIAETEKSITRLEGLKAAPVGIEEFARQAEEQLGKVKQFIDDARKSLTDFGTGDLSGGARRVLFDLTPQINREAFTAGLNEQIRDAVQGDLSLPTTVAEIVQAGITGGGPLPIEVAAQVTAQFALDSGKAARALRETFAAAVKPEDVEIPIKANIDPEFEGQLEEIGKRLEEIGKSGQLTKTVFDPETLSFKSALPSIEALRNAFVGLRKELDGVKPSPDAQNKINQFVDALESLGQVDLQSSVTRNAEAFKLIADAAESSNAPVADFETALKGLDTFLESQGVKKFDIQIPEGVSEGIRAIAEETERLVNSGNASVQAGSDVKKWIEQLGQPAQATANQLAELGTSLERSTAPATKGATEVEKFGESMRAATQEFEQGVAAQATAVAQLSTSIGGMSTVVQAVQQALSQLTAAIPNLTQAQQSLTSGFDGTVQSVNVLIAAYQALLQAQSAVAFAPQPQGAAPTTAPQPQGQTRIEAPRAPSIPPIILDVQVEVSSAVQAVQDALEGILSAAKGAASGLDDVEEAAGNVATSATSAADGIGELAGSLSGVSFSGIAEDADAVVASLGNIEGAFSGIATSAQGVMRDLSSSFENAGQASEDFADSVSGAGDRAESAAQGLTSLSRGFRDIANDAQNALNNLRSFFDELRRSGGSVSGSFNVTVKPGGAKGGVVTRPTELVIGEAGTEVLFPLDRLKSFIGDIQGSSRGSQVELPVGPIARAITSGIERTIARAAAPLRGISGLPRGDSRPPTDVLGGTMRSLTSSLDRATRGIAASARATAASGSRAERAIRVPGLAEGAFVTRPILAMLGERQPEGVLPLRALEELFSRTVAQGNRRLGSAGRVEISMPSAAMSASRGIARSLDDVARSLASIRSGAQRGPTFAEPAAFGGAGAPVRAGGGAPIGGTQTNHISIGPLVIEGKGSTEQELQQEIERAANVIGPRLANRLGTDGVRDQFSLGVISDPRAIAALRRRQGRL